MKKKEYTGVLKQRMDYPLTDSGKVKPEAAEQFLERVTALFDHYEIDMAKEGSGLQLALELARDNVPGFAVKNPHQHRPVDPKKESRNVTILAELSVASLLAEKKGYNTARSINNTARRLSKEHPEWGLTDKSIKALYYEKIRGRTGPATVAAVEAVADMILKKR
jgi:hypothetical protein